MITSEATAKTVQSSQLNQLAFDEYWLKLLKYRKTDESTWRSEITTPSFFLSSNGNIDPLRELTHTISAFTNSDSIDDNHPICQFVERYRWLNKKIWQQNESETLAKCSKFNEWSNLSKLNSASLIFASGYLGNPSSYFGHVLLKFNYEGQTRLSLLDKSVNFGAAIDSSDGPLTYVFKGFTGQYSASFKDDPFYRHLNVYANQESRSLWDYQLKLSKEQLYSLVAHTWELQEQSYKYFYLDENCASRMVELVNTIKPEFDLPSSVPWVHPVSVFKSNISLFERIDFHPSLVDKYTQLYGQLTPIEHNALTTIFASRDIDSADFQVLNSDSKINVINTAIAYLQMKQVYEGSPLYPFQQSILATRFSLKPKEIVFDSSSYQPPHFANYPSMLRVGFKINEQSNLIGATLQFRPSNYDILSNEAGRLNYSALEFVNLKLYVSEQDTYIESFDLVNITSLTPQKTAIEKEQLSSLSWQLQAGVSNSNKNCKTCLSPLLQAGLGKAYKYKSTLLYSLFNTGYYGNDREFDAKATLGMLITSSDAWAHHVEIEKYADFNYSQQSDLTIKIESRYQINDRFDIRLSVNTDEQETSFETSLSYFWQ